VDLLRYPFKIKVRDLARNQSSFWFVKEPGSMTIPLEFETEAGARAYVDAHQVEGRLMWAWQQGTGDCR
jgi:hypothetical protein